MRPRRCSRSRSQPLFLRDEPIRLNRTLGVIVGFVGVLVVMAPTLAAGSNADPLLVAAQVAITLASLSYAFGAVYARRYVTDVRPMVISLGMVSFGLLYTAPLALAIDLPRWAGLDLGALVAGAWLGILGSGVALLIFYRLLHDWGPTRTHVVVYLLPPIGVALGVLHPERAALRLAADRDGPHHRRSRADEREDRAPACAGGRRDTAHDRPDRRPSSRPGVGHTPLRAARGPGADRGRRRPPRDVERHAEDLGRPAADG